MKMSSFKFFGCYARLELVLGRPLKMVWLVLLLENVVYFWLNVCGLLVVLTQDEEIDLFYDELPVVRIRFLLGHSHHVLENLVVPILSACGVLLALW